MGAKKGTGGVDPALKRAGIWTKQRILLEHRRSRVATLLLAGQSYGAIAEKLDLSLKQVREDVKALRVEWAKRRLLADDEFDLDLARIEDVVKTIYPDLKDSSVAHIQQFVNLLGRKSRMLGYDAPTRVDTTIRPGAELEEISDEELEAFLRREMAKEAKRGKKKKKGDEEE